MKNMHAIIRKMRRENQYGISQKMGKRILLLGVYGMEMVECGGVLQKNAAAGGVSHGVITIAYLTQCRHVIHPCMMDGYQAKE